MTSEIEKLRSYEQEDEIDLIDLLISIWKGKWIIFLSAAFVAALGIIYFYISPTQYQANVELRVLTQGEAGWLNELSSLPNVDLDSSAIITMYANNLTDKNIVDKFTDEFINNQKSEVQSLDESNISVKVALLKNKGGQLDKINLTFSGTSVARQEFENYIVNFLAHVQQLTGDNVVSFVQSKGDLYQLNIQNQIELLLEQKRLAISQYQEKLSAEVTLLDEKISEVKLKTEATLKARIFDLNVHITIAKKLNLEQPGQNSGTETENISILNTIESNNSPLFLRGYVALEEELKSIEKRTNLGDFSKELRELMIKKEVLNNRDKIEAFVPEIISLNRKLQELENDIIGSRFNKFLEKENLTEFSPYFVKLNTSLNNQNFIKKTSPRTIIIALSIVAGLFFGLFLILTLNIIRSVKEKLTSKL